MLIHGAPRRASLAAKPHVAVGIDQAPAAPAARLAFTPKLSVRLKDRKGGRFIKPICRFFQHFFLNVGMPAESKPVHSRPRHH
jgi:hypothetical protein